VVDIHLVPRRVPRQARVIVAPGILAKAVVLLFFIRGQRLATATTLLFLFGGQVPRHYVDSHEGEGIARVRLYVSEVGRPLRLFHPVFVLFEGPLESLQGSLHNCELRAYFDIGLSSSYVVLQRRYHPLMQVISFLEAEAILGEVPSDRCRDSPVSRCRIGSTDTGLLP